MEFIPPTKEESLLGIICAVRDGLFPIFMSLAVIGFLVVAYLYLTAGGNEQKIETAKRTFKWVIGGTVFAILSLGAPHIIAEIFNTSLNSVGSC